MKYLAFLLTVVSAGLLIINCGGTKMQSVNSLTDADQLFLAQNYDSALAAYMATADIAENEGNKSVLTESYSQIARCHLINNDIESCRQWLEKAETIASADDPAGWSRYLGVRGRLEWQQAVKETGEYQPAVKTAAATFEDMYNYCLQHSLYERAVDAAHMMAIVDDPERRLAWGEKGIKAAENGGISGWLPALWNNHGWNLSDAGRHEEALAALLKAREYHYKTGREMSKLIADWSVGYAYRMVGQLDSAKTWMSKVYDWADSLYQADNSTENAEWLGLAAKEMGEIALADGNDKADARKYFELAVNKLKQAGMPEWDKNGFEEILNKLKTLEAESH